MKDYIRRSAKFILYIVLIFFVVLGLYPLMKYGKPLPDSLRDLFNNSRFTTMFGILMVYGMLYPMIAFVKIKRHLNGSFEQNRDKIERAFEKLEYVKTQSRVLLLFVKSHNSPGLCNGMRTRLPCILAKIR
jgi:hypothetical protein